ncbi:MAG: hypothetical protein HN704_02910 [Bacteroidetes bacterium]|jgi:hypothetical protein|nr:hypothetical protein [Bacteroidota bacterium]MBT6685465.1 hypothetical protein [Bacteroidota bacterium]MBT7144396.1 hypothetical protein [Bacteroidota bacterium]MBT7490538.1 hypothetical protein [Bacteroidota bacterium]
MKNGGLFLIITISILALKASGQDFTDKFILGTSTNLSFSLTNSEWREFVDDNIENTQLNFTFEGGIFARKYIYVGLKAPFSYYSDRVENGDKFSEFAYKICPVFRLYFTENYFRPFLNISVGPGGMIDKINSDEEYKFTILYYEAGGGLAFILNERFIAEYSINYIFSAYRPNYSGANYITKGVESEIGIKFIIF